MIKSFYENKNKIQKFFPAAALLILTIALMFFFKNRDIDNIYKDGKQSLVDFYTSNLKPLLFETTLTNEDVFNFAMYQRLPLDKEQNKNLVLNYNQDGQSGETFYSVQPSSNLIRKDNYEKFISNLDLSKDGKTKIDSILDGYKKPIYESIYSSENTVAVSPRLKSVRDALFADLMMAVKEANQDVWIAMVGGSEYFDDPERLYSFSTLAKNQPLQDFIVFAPDTVFATSFKVNTELIKDINKSLPKISHDLNENQFLTIDEKSHTHPVQVIVRNIPIPEIPEIPSWSFDKEVLAKNYKYETHQFDSLMKSIDLMSEKLFSFNFAMGMNEIGEELQIEINSLNKDSLENLNINFNFGSLNNLINESVQKSMRSVNWNEWEELGVKFDSLGLLIEQEAARYDSLMKANEMTFILNVDSLKEAIKKKKKQK